MRPFRVRVLASLFAVACAPTRLPPVAMPPGADVAVLSAHGEDVPDLARHAVRGKITLFDLHADWCPPCRRVDVHVAEVLARRSDLAVRKLDVVSWETPLAERYLKKVTSLPLLVVFGKDGRRRATLEGFDPEALDRAIEEAGAP